MGLTANTYSTNSKNSRRGNVKTIILEEKILQNKSFLFKLYFPIR